MDKTSFVRSFPGRTFFMTFNKLFIMRELFFKDYLNSFLVITSFSCYFCGMDCLNEFLCLTR